MTCGARVARLGPGPSLLKPRLDLIETDHLSGTWRERVRQHLARWLQDRIDEAMRPLGKLIALEGSAPSRGLVFQLSENLGSVDRAAVADLLAGLPRPEKKQLKRARRGTKKFRELEAAAGVPRARLLELAARVEDAHDRMTQEKNRFKGIPGVGALGRKHCDISRYPWKPDPDLVKLREWIGGDVDEYAKYGQASNKARA